MRKVLYCFSPELAPRVVSVSEVTWEDHRSVVSVCRDVMRGPKCHLESSQAEDI